MMSFAFGAFLAMSMAYLYIQTDGHLHVCRRYNVKVLTKISVDTSSQISPYKQNDVTKQT